MSRTGARHGYRKRPAQTEPVAVRGECGHRWETTYSRAREHVRGDNLTMRCPECRRQVEPTFDASSMRCKRCTNPLSFYNPGPNCNACDEDDRAIARDAARREEEQAERAARAREAFLGSRAAA